jgi:hypothetical protein
MKEFFDYFTKERVEYILVTVFLICILGIVYSIIAGIWGFAPIININWKIFGTSVVIGVITVIVRHLNDDTK